MFQRPGADPLQLRTPERYQSWTADQKAQWLWRNLILGTAHRPTELPPLVLPFRTAPLREASVVLRAGELDKTLTRISDLMEPGRPKFIHARGSVAMVRFQPDELSPFTGLLARSDEGGGAVGLVRMSLVARVFGDAAYTPALALKLLIDGTPSADVLAMNHTVGQGRDFNLFSNTMTNDLSYTHNELRTAQRLMSVLFNRVSRQPRRMVSDHLAQVDNTGTIVDEPIAPDRLIFESTQAARAVFIGRAGVDFRIVLGEMAPDITLFTVTGVRGPERVPVGTITMTTPFVSSDGGDRLFFRHVHDPADRKLA